MLGKTHWTASRRPNEESAQGVDESTGHDFIMDDGADLEPDKLEGMNNLSHASKHEDGGGDPEYDEYMIGPSYEEQHREDEGGGERDNPVHMGREAQRKITRHETYLIEEAIEYRYGDEMGGGERDQCDVSDTVELQNYLPQVKMTGGPVDDSWAWTKLRYLTSSAIRAILQHLRGTRRRRLWKSVWDAKAGLPGIFGR
jgi:hypothetical protein